MKRRCVTWTALCVLSILAGSPDAAVSGQIADHDSYAALLTRYVNNGVVDYNGIKHDEVRLDKYLNTMAAVDPDQLTANDQMAFYINVYNAWTIKLILTRYPELSSIKDLGSLFQSPWKKKIVKLRGATVTLDHIEHEILRPKFKDPRIHFAVNCASKGCPPLFNEPFVGERLDRQLDHVTRSFINNPRRNYLKGDTLHISRIFKWFAEDFPGGALAFFEAYAAEELKQKLTANKTSINIAYLAYDWSLNGQ